MNCMQVCPEWKSYLQSSIIWRELLRREALKAQNFRTKALSLLSSDVKFLWLWKFILKKLNFGAFIAFEVDLKSENLENIREASKHLSQRLELAKKIEMFPDDIKANLFRAHEFMMHEEIQLEKIRKNYRNRAGLECSPNEDKMHEAMLKICCVRSLSSETFYQVS